MYKYNKSIENLKDLMNKDLEMLNKKEREILLLDTLQINRYFYTFLKEMLKDNV
jgi:hypothetical protein